MRASIKQDNDTILSDIEVSLNETANPLSGLGSWSGMFACAIDDIDTEEYRLLLEDGRSGNIIVTYISGTLVYFTGSGPLA